MTTKRKQRKGNQKPWTIEEIKDGLNNFYSEHNRYPTTAEFDKYSFLPSSRQIQRRFGGLVELRKTLGLTGPKDFTKGAYSSARAKTINERANLLEKEIFDYLVNKFGKISVHREYFFTDDRRTRTDFFVYCKNNKHFSVDVFYPKDRQNLLGCINSKLRTYRHAIMLEYPVIFLMMNKDITEDDIRTLLDRKKNKLHKNQEVMTMGQFKTFCDKQKPMERFEG